MSPQSRITTHGWIGRTALAVALVLLAAGNLAAQDTEEADGLRITRSRVTGRARFVTSADGGAIAVRTAAGRAVAEPIEFFRQHGRLFGVSDPATQLVVDKAEIGPLGQTHTTYKQIHHGIPVFGGVLKVHQSGDGAFRVANGEFFPVPDDLPTLPTIQADAAVDVARKALAEGSPNVVQSDLVIVDPGWYGDPAIGAHLAYHVVLQDSPAGIMEAFFVDAQTAAILDRWSMIHTARVRRVDDAEGGPNFPGTLVRVEGQPATGITDVDEAYDYLGDTYDYYFRAFGRDNINPGGTFIDATVRLGSGVITCPNAFWNGSRMVFCTGVAADDVVGHEYTHGVTQFSANLIYQNQSGQLNESYSDVFGELIDLFNGGAAIAGVVDPNAWPTPPTNPGLDAPNGLRTMCSRNGPLGGSDFSDGVRWLIGEDAGFGDAIRDMWDPTCKGHPDRANSELQTCGDPGGGDNGGVHSGSGIPNHAFAMLTDGKTFNGFTVTGIGPIKAGAVWYRALTVYLTPTSDFQAAFTALKQAAADLVGTTPNPNDPSTGLPSSSMFTADDAVEVKKALLAVEMNTLGRCGSGAPPLPGADTVLLPDDPPSCPSAVTIFADDFENEAPGWTVGNSGPAVPVDWVLLGEPLPFDRTGTVWFVANKADGDCAVVDESATHSLFSPVINMPAVMEHPLLSFLHHVACQGGWDGGNIRIRVNGGSWQAVPRTAIVFNPYNARLNSVAQGSNNPAAGEEAWSGVGMDWGTSVVDLAGMVNAGDTLEVRFDFNTNCDGGVEGWYVDDFAVYTCTDCNENGLSDDREFRYSAASPTFVGLVDGQKETFTLLNPPRAVQGSMVKLFVVASGDFEPLTQAVNVSIHFPPVNTFAFVGGATSCPAMNGIMPDSEIIRFKAKDFNDAASFGSVDFDLQPVNIGPATCGGESFFNVFIVYDAQAEDCNGNMILDACDPDCNGNGMADECDADGDGDGVPNDCDICPGADDLSDADGDGVPDGCDLCAGANDATDSDGDGVPDCLDNCPITPNADQANSVGGGIGDACRDCNNNGALDLADLTNGTSQDCNGDLIPDECGVKPVEARPGNDTTIAVGQSIPLGAHPAAVGTTPPYAYQWTLPDNPGGASSSLPNPTYGPLPAGVYTATLTVTGSTGCTSTASVIITVQATTTAPTTPTAGEPAVMPANDFCSGFFGAPAALMLAVMIISHRRTRRHRRVRRDTPARPAQ